MNFNASGRTTYLAPPAIALEHSPVQLDLIGLSLTNCAPKCSMCAVLDKNDEVLAEMIDSCREQTNRDTTAEHTTAQDQKTTHAMGGQRTTVSEDVERQ